MLALILRGLFIAGAVGWYSTSMWRMIDGYFKDQFQRYLEDEYQRNPKMQRDVREHGALDKTAMHLADKVPKHAVDEILASTCSLHECTVGAAGRREDESVPPKTVEEASGAGATVESVKTDVPVERAEDDADIAELRKNELDAETYGKQDSVIELQHEQQRLEKRAEENEEYKEQDDLLCRVTEVQQEWDQRPVEKEEPRTVQRAQGKLGEAPEEDDSAESKNDRQPKIKQKPIRKKRKKSARPQIGARSEQAALRKQKRAKFPTLTLTDGDFDSAARRKQRYGDEAYDDDDWDGERMEEDRDFAEFDDDEGNKRRDEDEVTGLLVTDLPFRPAIDIYDLERVSGEEFCPLTLEDDPSCEETREWP